MLESSTADHNAGCGIEARGPRSRVTIRGDSGKETITRTINRRSKFATRTRVQRDTATSFQNGESNVREDGGGRIVFVGGVEIGVEKGGCEVEGGAESGGEEKAGARV